jgi:hypothetical protein
MQHIVVLLIDSGDPSVTDFHHGLLGKQNDSRRRVDSSKEIPIRQRQQYPCAQARQFVTSLDYLGNRKRSRSVRARVSALD